MANPFVFDDAISGANSNITNTRSNASAIDNTKSGIVNNGSDTTQSLPGARANYATILGGDGCTARGEHATVGGHWSTCDATSGFACGEEAIVLSGGTGTVAIGQLVQAQGDGATAIGISSRAYGQGATAIGNGAYANGSGAVAIGLGPVAKSVANIAIGEICTAYHPWAMCIGVANHGFGAVSLCLNEDTIAFGQRSISAGFVSETAAERAMAIGSVARAEAFGSICLGIQGVATDDGQFTLGGGSFLEAQETPGGDVQTSLRVLRARTFGFEIGEVGTFAGGVDGNVPWDAVAGRSYHIKIRTVVSATLMPSRVRVSSTFIQEACVKFPTTGPIVVQPGPVTQLSTDSAYTSSWTFGINPDGSITYSLGTTRAKSNAVATIEYDEVIFNLDTPIEIPDCTLWLECQRGITLSAIGTIQSWADQSGKGNDWTAVGAQQPSYPPNIANTEHAVRFDGVSNVLTCTGKTLADLFGTGSEYTFFIVTRATGSNSSTDPKQRPCIFSDSSGIFGVAEFVAGSDVTFYHTDATTAYTPNCYAVNTDTPDILVAWYGLQAQWYIFRVAGDLYETGNPIEAGPLASLTGTPQLGVNFNQKQFCPCDVFEVITYNRQLTYQERNQVLNYLNDKWRDVLIDPLSDGNTALWYRADMGIQLSGTNVTQWANSGLNNDPNATCLPPTLANEPSYIQSDPAYNYQPTLQFNGSQALFGPAALTAPIRQPCTVYLVGEIEGSGGVAVAGDSASQNAILQSATAVWAMNSGSEIDSTTATNAPNVVAANFNSPTCQIYVGGMITPQGSGDSGPASLTRITIGGVESGGTLVNGMTGKIAEYIVRTGIDSPTTMAQFGAYLKTRYQL